MTSFLELKDEVRGALGGVDTQVASDAIKRGLNAGLQAATFLYKPPESEAIGTLTATSADNKVSTVDLDRLMWIESIYSETSSHKVYRLPINLLDMPWVPTIGIIQFFCERGGYLHYRPAADETLTVYYLSYPERLVDDSNTYPYGMHEDFVVAFGTAYAWAVLEEGDSSDLWGKIADRVNIPESTFYMLKRLVKLEVTGDDNV